MGYVFDFQDAQAYRRWLEKPRNRHAMALQTGLMAQMLAPKRLESILCVGCGTGESLRPLVDMGADVTGIDPSPYMLDIAAEQFGPKLDLHRGVAEDLPFEDNAFNQAVLFYSLEFVEDPAKALSEACRVARDCVFIGVMNRYAVRNLRFRLQRWIVPSVFDHARFFSIWELQQMLYALLGEVPISWRTISQLPLHSRYVCWIENLRIVQHFPFGAFIGLVVTLVPRYRTRPLKLQCPAQSPPGVVSG